MVSFSNVRSLHDQVVAVAAEHSPVMSIDGRTLTCERLAANVDQPVRVRLSVAARRRSEASFRAATAAVTQRQVYGRTTGVGANRSIGVDAADLAAGTAHTLALLRSHATSAGPLRSSVRVRATLVVRLNQLAAGGSGISMTAIDALAAMINADALPPIREHSGIGTGDLTALATTALGLLGEVPLTAPLRPVRFGVHDALPFFSSNAATLADAAIASARLQTLARAGLAVAALTGMAVSANFEAFGPVVERATPGPGARRVCRTILALSDPDGIGLPVAGRIQDPFAMRCLPQVNGLLLEALDRLDQVVSGHLNVAAENPVIVSSPDDQMPAVVAHHGGFHIPAVSGLRQRGDRGGPVGALAPRPAGDAGRSGRDRSAGLPRGRNPRGLRRDDAGVPGRLGPGRSARLRRPGVAGLGHPLPGGWRSTPVSPHRRPSNCWKPPTPTPRPWPANCWPRSGRCGCAGCGHRTPAGERCCEPAPI